MKKLLKRLFGLSSGPEYVEPPAEVLEAMSKQISNDTAELILNGLEKEEFKVWHDDGVFIDYIEGGEDCKTREEILEDIKQLFRLSW